MTRKTQGLALGLAAVFLLPLAALAGNVSPYKGDLGGKIVFSAMAGTQWDLFAVDPQGGKVERLTNDKEMERFPAVSPDGARVLYIGDRKDVWMYTPRTGGKAAVPLPAGTYGHPAWAPDGKEFACAVYTALPTDASELIRVREAEKGWGTLERLTTFPPMVLFPDYAPDGKRLACSVFRRDPALGVIENLAVLNIGEKKTVLLTDAKMDQFEPVWSPDGKTLAFTSNRAGNYDVWTRAADAPVDGTKDTRVTLDRGFDGEAAFSPDGGELVFVSNRTGRRELWTAPVRGGAERRLTDLKSSVASPSWARGGMAGQHQ
jgi:Tol biopolymer transport system component